MYQAPHSSQLPVTCVHFYLSFQTWIHTSYAKTSTVSWDVDTAGSSGNPGPSLPLCIRGGQPNFHGHLQGSPKLGPKC